MAIHLFHCQKEVEAETPKIVDHVNWPRPGGKHERSLQYLGCCFKCNDVVQQLEETHDHSSHGSSRGRWPKLCWHFLLDVHSREDLLLERHYRNYSAIIVIDIPWGGKETWSSFWNQTLFVVPCTPWKWLVVVPNGRLTKYFSKFFFLLILLFSAMEFESIKAENAYFSSTKNSMANGIWRSFSTISATLEMIFICCICISYDVDFDNGLVQFGFETFILRRILDMWPQGSRIYLSHWTITHVFKKC